ncbi:MAG TPA: F420-0:Gamma-glutamyl ligase [Firmicutes bacterium]|nr:F420-0:Gamma-glutamyl ligase [Bacillota bacterium]
MKKIPVKTHVITESDDIVQLAVESLKEQALDGDIIVISSKVVSISQGLVKPFDELKITGLARFLSKFVTKPLSGEGLGRVEKMQGAIDEAGALRILFAAIIGGIGKMMGIHGWFYRVAGRRAGAIDGADGVRAKTVGPYNRVLIFAPVKGDEVCEKVKAGLGKKVEIAIIDANDYGDVDVWGQTDGLDAEFVENACADNFLGQRLEQTPLGIIRP